MTIAFQRYNGSEWVTETESSSGGVTNHASLTNLAWELSKHTGTADKYAGWDSNGDPAELDVSVPTNVLVNDADDTTSGKLTADSFGIESTIDHTITDISDKFMLTNFNQDKAIGFSVNLGGTQVNNHVSIGGSTPGFSIDTDGETISAGNTGIINVGGTWSFGTGGAMNFAPTISSGNFIVVFARPVINSAGLATGLGLEPSFGNNNRDFTALKFSPTQHNKNYNDTYSLLVDYSDRNVFNATIAGGSDSGNLTYNGIKVGGAIAFLDFDAGSGDIVDRHIQLTGGAGYTRVMGNGTITQRGLTFSGYYKQATGTAGVDVKALEADGGIFSFAFDHSTTVTAVNKGLVTFGYGDNSAIGYNGTDFVIDTALVGSGTLDLVSQSVTTISTETLSEYVTIKIGGVSKKIAIVA